MGAIKFECSNCRQRLELEERYAGHQIICPQCNKPTLVPSIGGKAASAAAKSGMTFVPEAWQKPGPRQDSASSAKSGMTHVPESWGKTKAKTKTPPPPK